MQEIFLHKLHEILVSNEHSLHSSFVVCQLVVYIAYAPNFHASFRMGDEVELKEGDSVDFRTASFQHANGVIHIEGALLD